MGRSQESFHKKEVQKKKAKKKKDKEKKRLERKESGKSSNFDDMIAYVDENGMLVSSPPEKNKDAIPNAEDIEVSVPKMDPADKDKARVGRLSFYNESKGYGFITESGTGQSVFVHVNDFQDDIRQGDQVEFELGKGQKGPSAFNVKLKK